MDASSIITQVPRDEDHVNVNSFPPPDRGNGSASVTVNSGSSKNSCSGRNSNNGILKRLFSCCWRNTSSTDEAEECTTNGTNGGPPANGANGVCLPDDVSAYPLPATPPLLPQQQERDVHRKCMVIDLDETLVHSSFKPISNADFVVPVEIDGTVHQVYVLKRPNVDDFLQKMGDLYECVLFTASLAKYADPVADLLDRWGVFRARLFRESCVFHRGNYVKDLSRLGRDLNKVVIMDNSPASYIFHPDNAVPVSSWFDDMTDSELLDLIPFLETLSHVDSVYSVLRGCTTPHPPILPPKVMTSTAPALPQDTATNNNSLMSDTQSNMSSTNSPITQVNQQQPSPSIDTEITT